jgi:hypothetical protein
VAWDRLLIAEPEGPSLYGAISVKADGRVSRGIAVNMGSAR